MTKKMIIFRTSVFFLLKNLFLILFNGTWWSWIDELVVEDNGVDHCENLIRIFFLIHIIIMKKIVFCVSDCTLKYYICKYMYFILPRQILSGLNG